MLVDFGLARDIAHGDTLSRTGDRTVEYASPEQLGRGKQLIDGRSDVWSLGVTLYETAAGELPFGERDAEIAIRILHEDPTPLHEVNPAVPRDFEMIVMKCLEKERDRRYQAAQELADDLQRWLDGKPILARPPSVLRRIRKGIAKHRVVFAVASSVLIAYPFR